jgi:HAD superfamily hydrolase (TIGR01662 family)
MGYNAGGKSSLVQGYVDTGYFRMNRDETGGTLNALAEKARNEIVGGRDKIVLDNTYLTAESRESIIAVGAELGIPVRCVWLTTSFEDAQLNACLRMCQKTGHILMPDEFKSGPYKNDPNLFPPVVLFAAKKKLPPKGGDKKAREARELNMPSIKEGFAVIEERKFVRVWPATYTNGAYLFDYDDTLRRSTGKKAWPQDPSEVEILPGRKEKLDELAATGVLLLGVSNQSAIAKDLDEDVAIACFERTNELLGHKIEYQYCPHKIPPVSCYCRKPSSGIGAFFIWKYHLLPSKCTMVGDQTSDKTFAKRCGFEYVDASDFFGTT